MYKLKELQDPNSIVNGVAVQIDGRWHTARPASWGGLYGTWLRAKDAWQVLTGKADAFTWPGGQ